MQMTDPRVVKRSLKILVMAAILAVALLFMANIAAEPVLNAGAFKSRIENSTGPPEAD